MGERRYLIAFYCPDTNLRLDGNIPGKRGLGGGKTAVIKLARALCIAGHNVTVYAYCNEGIFDGVEYRDPGKIRNLTCDVLIAITGHKCDISDLYRENTKAGLNILWLSGSAFIEGIDKSFFDFYYANSIFLKKRAVTQWGLPFEKVIAVHQGFDPEDFGDADAGSDRDPFGMVFASHPDKGLLRTVDIISRLRDDLDAGLSLDLYGGWQLWNDADDRGAPVERSWIRYHGLMAQPGLCRRLPGYGFMLHLTDYEDTSSILIQQAKRAGIIVIASGVGGNSELIEDGFDGFIVREDYRSEKCYDRVKRLVGYLLEDREYAGYIRGNARCHPLTWDRIAGDWISHWTDTLGGLKKKRVLISGFFGYKNLGDETILSCMIDGIKNTGYDAEITVVSADPYFTEKEHKVRAVHRENFSLLDKEVERADLVVLGGGGLFHDHDRIRISRFFEEPGIGVTSFAQVPLMAKIHQKPVFYYAHGVGPLFSREAFLFSKWAFGLADSISVRDEYSYNVLAGLLDIDRAKVHLSFDPALTAPLPSPHRAKAAALEHAIPRDTKLILVAPRYWINKTHESRALRELGNALNAFLEESDNRYFVVIIPFDRHDTYENDIGICEELAAQIRSSSVVLKNYSGYEEILSLFLAAEFVVGMRYHSLIFAAIANTPVIAVSYDKKDSEIMRDLGLEELSVDIGMVEAGIVKAHIQHVNNNRKEVREVMKMNVERIVRRFDSRLMLQDWLTDQCHG